MFIRGFRVFHLRLAIPEGRLKFLMIAIAFLPLIHELIVQFDGFDSLIEV